MAQYREEPQSGRNEASQAEEARAQARPEQPGGPASLSGLFTNLMRETMSLIRDETALARAELSQKMSQAQSGVVMLLTAAVLGIVALNALAASAIVALSNVVSIWLAALIVGAALAVLALIFLGVGRSRLKAKNLPPDATMASIRKDVGMLREHTQ